VDYQLMNYHFTETQLLVTSFVLIILMVIAVGAYVDSRKARAAALRNLFGSEYDRALDIHSTERETGAGLSERETRVSGLRIRELGITERGCFVAEWHAVQSRFLDNPRMAVMEADDLINELVEARGYPPACFEQRSADALLHYPRFIETYRHAHSIAVHSGQGGASTEQLRSAMIEYRDIFDELLRAQNPWPIPDRSMAQGFRREAV
jgi:hypothetical protein